MLQKSFQLAFKNLVKFIYIRVFCFKLTQLFNTRHEEWKFLKNLLQNLHILIVNWFMKKIIQTEATRNDKHKTFIELCSYIK